MGPLIYHVVQTPSHFRLAHLGSTTTNRFPCFDVSGLFSTPKPIPSVTPIIYIPCSAFNIYSDTLVAKCLYLQHSPISHCDATERDPHRNELGGRRTLPKQQILWAWNTIPTSWPWFLYPLHTCRNSNSILKMAHFSSGSSSPLSSLPSPTRDETPTPPPPRKQKSRRFIPPSRRKTNQYV